MDNTKYETEHFFKLITELEAMSLSPLKVITMNVDKSFKNHTIGIPNYKSYIQYHFRYTEDMIEFWGTITL